ncbi:MAG: hypothetical protein Q7S40_05485 [Opitutaceae bacterium]|nr:hypothetical protein [Opitutaceae bacterium]
MNLLDENFPEDQRPRLRQWRIPFRQIGHEVGWHGVKDDNVLGLLHRLRRVTLFTQDQDFFQKELCHPTYCLLYLDVCADDAAEYVRRFLRHPLFDTQAKRMGVVARAHHEGIEFWQRIRAGRQRANWLES